jgi:methylmalonyl-CoA/ethylmalonyl-CoA epimerase
VPDIGAVVARLKSRGVKMIDDEPRPGAGGSLIAFVHPAGTGGVLLELKQDP